MVERHEKKDWFMNCHVCGAAMYETVTNLPFKLSATTIAIVKHVPVFECSNCREYLLGDKTVQRVEEVLSTVDETTELGVVDFAA